MYFAGGRYGPPAREMPPCRHSGRHDPLHVGRLRLAGAAATAAPRHAGV